MPAAIDNRGTSPFGPDIKVAVIGAGVSGISTAAHLLRRGLDVTVFERSGEIGGVWNYQETPPPSPSYPSVRPSVGDHHHAPLSKKDDHFIQNSTSNGLNGLTIKENGFAPSSPCYSGLQTNIPTSIFYTSLKSWPSHTSPLVRHTEVKQHLQELSVETGVTNIVRCNTRVERVIKNEDGRGWHLETKTLVTRGKSEEIVDESYDFDAVVVASGHYNLPRVPDIPGLTKLKNLSPNRVIHSKQYRRADVYRDSNVLVIGGGVSAMDITRELSHTAASVTQSTRGGEFDLPETMISPAVKRVGAIAGFSYETNTIDTSEGYVDGSITAILNDGSRLQNLDNVILATGYLISFPFLPQFHSDDTPAVAVGPSTLIGEEGNMVHNLYKDIFFIDDATLAFVGLPYHIVTFSTFDYQAQAVAQIFSGLASLPVAKEMRSEYQSRVKANGFGMKFHSQAKGDVELKYVESLVDLISQGSDYGSGTRVSGHGDKWLRDYAVFKEGLKR